MIRGMIGKKLGMTQIFDKEGNLLPATVVEAGPCVILDLMDEPKKKATLGFEPANEKRLKKPQRGLYKKLNLTPMKVIREFHSTDNSEYKIGQEIKADLFRAGDFVDVSGVSVGKGFQGGMKRWHWSGGPAGHGSMHHRRVGSIGASADPSRTLRGTNMPGQMGSKNVTTQGLRVLDVDTENNVILIKGSVPGHKKSIVLINLSQKKAYKSLEEKKAAVVHKVNPMKQSKAAHAKGKK